MHMDNLFFNFQFFHQTNEHIVFASHKLVILMVAVYIFINNWWLQCTKRLFPNEASTGEAVSFQYSLWTRAVRLRRQAASEGEKSNLSVLYLARNCAMIALACGLHGGRYR
jgi:hypothetical protein